MAPLRRLREGAQLVKPMLPPSLVPRDLARHGWRQLEAAMVLQRSGLLRSFSPARLPLVVRELMRWGLSPVTAFEISVQNTPERAFLVDDEGTLSFAEVEERTNAIAARLQADGLREGAAVGILARNGRGFVEAALALWKLGVDSVYLNTSFAAPEVAHVVKSEKLAGVIHEAEFARAIPARVRRWRIDGARPLTDARGRPAPGGTPARQSRHVILTSGTTGRAKGAPRSTPTSIEPALALLSRIPLRVEEPTLIAAPLFHAWGFAHLSLGLLLSSTLVLSRRFDAEATLASVAEHRVAALVAVPVMLQRIVELPPRARRRHDTSSLRVVAVSGSPLTGELAQRFMDQFGDIVYNLYGSTEVAWAAIATPEDLRAAPGTAGRPPRGTVVRLYGEDDQPVGDGEPGRIFVANEMQIESYTSGERRDSIDGLLATGDIGRFDADGRLFVEGRSDEMIVSGGENVYPGEIEELLKAHPEVADVAVVGVEDPQFGQALKAVVVTKGGGKASEEALKKHVESKVARFKVPRSFQFVPELPRNPAGKVLKEQLKQPPDGAQKPRAPGRVAARGKR